jgi:hypothetical protein
MPSRPTDPPHRSALLPAVFVLLGIALIALLVITVFFLGATR